MQHFSSSRSSTAHDSACVIDTMSGGLAHEAQPNESGQEPRCMMDAGDPAFMSQLAFTEASSSLVDRSRNADLVGMEWRLRDVFGEVWMTCRQITLSLIAKTINFEKNNALLWRG